MNERIAAGKTAPDFTFDTPWKKSQKLSDIARKGKTVLMFLRYAGCPLCQMKIAELRGGFEEFKKRKVNLLVVLQSTPENITKVVEKKDIPFEIVCDPKEKLFSLYGVKPGTIFGYITPTTIIKAIQSTRRGFKHGTYEGNEKQLPAVFIIGAGRKVDYVYYGKNVADVPATKKLLAIIDRK